MEKTNRADILPILNGKLSRTQFLKYSRNALVAATALNAGSGLGLLIPEDRPVSYSPISLTFQFGDHVYYQTDIPDVPQINDPCLRIYSGEIRQHEFLRIKRITNQALTDNTSIFNVNWSDISSAPTNKTLEKQILDVLYAVGGIGASEDKRLEHYQTLAAIKNLGYAIFAADPVHWRYPTGAFDAHSCIYATAYFASTVSVVSGIQKKYLTRKGISRRSFLRHSLTGAAAAAAVTLGFGNAIKDGKIPSTSSNEAAAHIFQASTDLFNSATGAVFGPTAGLISEVTVTGRNLKMYQHTKLLMDILESSIASGSLDYQTAEVFFKAGLGHAHIRNLSKESPKQIESHISRLSKNIISVFTQELSKIDPDDAPKISELLNWYHFLVSDSFALPVGVGGIFDQPELLAPPTTKTKSPQLIFLETLNREFRASSSPYNRELLGLLIDEAVLVFAIQNNVNLEDKYHNSDSYLSSPYGTGLVREPDPQQVLDNFCSFEHRKRDSFIRLNSDLSIMPYGYYNHSGIPYFVFAFRPEQTGQYPDILITSTWDSRNNEGIRVTRRV